MTNHCDTKAPAAFADEQVAPLLADGGEVVRYRHLKVRWVFDAISDYWRKPVT